MPIIPALILVLDQTARAEALLASALIPAVWSLRSAHFLNLVAVVFLLAA
jgi:hypothetical protein